MTYPSTGARRRAKDPVGHWALAGGLLAVLVWSVYEVLWRVQNFGGHGLAYSLGYGAVGSVIIAPVVWFVVYFGFVRRSAPERGMPYFLILFFFSVAVQAGAAVLLGGVVEAQKAQSRTAEHEIESAISALKSPDAARIDTRPKATGDAGEIERLTKTYFANLQSDRNAYFAEMKAAGMMDALKPENIAKDPSLRRTRAGLAKAKEIAKAYRARYQARRTEVRASIVTSALSPAAKSATLASFDRSLAQGDRGDKIWDLEDALLVEMDATLVDLQRTEGLWRVRGHVIAFTDDAALKAYNQHIANLRALAQQEQDLRDQGMRQGVEQLRSSE